MGAFTFNFGSSNEDNTTYGDVGVPPMLDPNYPGGVVPQYPSTPNGTNQTGSTFGTVLNNATSILGSILGYKLQQNQINHGMYPSVGYQNGWMPTGQPVAGLGGLSSLSGGWLWLIIIAVVLLLVLRR